MTSGIGVNLRVTGHCSQGGRKYMEDMFSVAYQQTVNLKDLEYAFFGIFDGHGGPQAARFAKEHLLDSIVSQNHFWSGNDEDVLRAIRDGYLATHYSMWKDLEKWPKTTTGLPSTSGSTATVAFIMRGKLFIGHVGDTAIVLGYQEDGVKEWKAKVLTKDHKPESLEEKQRIEQSGGKVVNKSGVPRVVWNRPRLGHQGPVRRSTPIDEIPFLAVARSLGDFWSYNSALDQFVVSPEPDVFVCPVDVSKFRCLVLGTDGLWNMMTPERAVAIVQATEINNEKHVIYGRKDQYNKDWMNPSKTLVDKALERWCMTKLRADNTSVVTLLLDPPGPPRAQVLRKQISQMQEESLDPDEPDESKLTVPKSGGMAILTQYPSTQDRIVTAIQRSEKIVRLNNYIFSSKIVPNTVQTEKGPLTEAKTFNDDVTSSEDPLRPSIPLETRLEGKNSMEDGSSDAENKSEFSNNELKKRRLSLEKKSSKPGIRRRSSLPALNGKTNTLCKSRSLEESTRMLRSATPIKTLRSRNIDLSDLSSSAGTKRSRAPSPPPNKKQRLEERPGNKPVNKSSDSESPFYMLRTGDVELFEDSVKGDLSKMMKDRKHKSVWQENEDSDGGTISRRLRLTPENKRQSRTHVEITKK